MLAHNPRVAGSNLVRTLNPTLFEPSATYKGIVFWLAALHNPVEILLRTRQACGGGRPEHLVLDERLELPPPAEGN